MLKKLCKWVRSALGKAPLPEGPEHDYRRSMWGHAIASWHTKDEGQTVRASGFGPLFSPWNRRLRRGDYLILQASPETESRYQIVNVTYSYDPSDMWEADLRFAPRLARPKPDPDNLHRMAEYR